MNERELQRAAEFIRTKVQTQGGPVEHAGRARLLAALEKRKPRRVRNVLALAVATCAVVVAIGVAAHRQKHPALTYRVGTSTEIGEVGSYVSAPAAARLDLNFSEGSRVVLEPKARVRVARSTSHGATMVLEDGRASVDVVHRPDTDWKILAGPYVVQVAGTSFEVSYDVSTQTFQLDMREGVVRVTGPGLAMPGEIRGRQRLMLAPGSSQSQVSAPAASSNSTTPPDHGAPGTNAPSASSLALPDSPTQTETSAFVEKKKAAESWSQLAIRAEHRKIIELAEKLGIEQSLESAGGPDLFALANAARIAGKQHLAGRAYRAIRSRFGGSAEATSAAFFLGRVHEGSDPAIAIGWYEQYFHDAPSGVWVAEALGRRMVLLNASQGSDAARKAAEDYLRRFPSGPYAGFAEKILQP